MKDIREVREWAQQRLTGLMAWRHQSESQYREGRIAQLQELLEVLDADD